MLRVRSSELPRGSDPRLRSAKANRHEERDERSERDPPREGEHQRGDGFALGVESGEVAEFLEIAVAEKDHGDDPEQDRERISKIAPAFFGEEPDQKNAEERTEG